MNPWLILGAVLVIVGAFLAGQHDGATRERTTWTARIEKERADATEAARALEHRQQEAINAALKRQARDLAGIHAGLRADLERLRDRPERPADLPEAARAACAGGTGAELSRPDAEFLAGEAARADEQRAGLVACYTALDGLRP